MKLIHFITEYKKAQLGKPQPAKNHIPEWYRNSESSFVIDGKDFPGLKKCAPFLDAIMAGYVVVTPFDIFVTRDKDGSVKFSWTGPDEFSNYINERPKQSGELMPRPAGHNPNHLVWSSPWGFKLPRGYSAIVCHPYNRFDLPFTTSAGIIDSDKFWANGNLPFYIKEDFTGTIPEGTPIAQVIPFKRDKWKSIFNQGLIDKIKIQGKQARLSKTKYKVKDWVKKEFN